MEGFIAILDDRDHRNKEFRSVLSFTVVDGEDNKSKRFNTLKQHY
jgi:hypothetical protein